MAGLTSIRTAAKARLATVLTAALSGVQVSYGWPGQDVARETVYIGKTRGAYEHAGFQAGRKQREDRFTVDVWFVAANPGQATPLVAEQRVETLFAALDTALADDPRIGNTVSGLSWSLVGSVDGPDSSPNDEGWVSVIRAEVEFVTRLT